MPSQAGSAGPLTVFLLFLLLFLSSGCLAGAVSDQSKVIFQHRSERSNRVLEACHEAWEMRELRGRAGMTLSREDPTSPVFKRTPPPFCLPKGSNPIFHKLCNPYHQMGPSLTSTSWCLGIDLVQAMLKNAIRSLQMDKCHTCRKHSLAPTPIRYRRKLQYDP